MLARTSRVPLINEPIERKNELDDCRVLAPRRYTHVLVLRRNVQKHRLGLFSTYKKILPLLL